MNTACLSPNGVDVYSLQGPPDTLFVATTDGIAELRADKTGAWTNVRRHLSGLHVGSLIHDTEDEGLFAGSYDRGLYRSLDGGENWTPASVGIEPENIFSLGCDSASHPATLYAGTEPAYLYRSTDLGATWEEVKGLHAVPSRADWNFPAPPHIAHVKHTIADPRDSRILYVCIEQGALLKSVDDGTNFFELHFQDDSYVLNKDTHRIVFHPDNPDRIYLDGGDGIAVSDDAGETWTRIADTSVRVGYPDHLHISPEADRTIYVSGGGTPPNIWRETGDATSTIMRSRDDGGSWEQFGTGMPRSLKGNIEALTLAHWPGGFGFFAGTTDGEVFASIDRGENWSMIADDIGAVSKCVHHRNLTMGRAAVEATSNSPAE